MGSDRDIDDAIDRAVRDIMGADPPPRLRARVLQRIERPATTLALQRFAAAAAVFAVAVIAFILMRPEPAPVPHSRLATQEAPHRPEATPGVPAPSRDVAPPTPGPDPASRQVARQPRRTRGAQTVPSAEFPGRGMVAAATVAGRGAEAATPAEAVPIPLDPDAEPILIQAIRVEPLVMERIVLRPIASMR